MGVVYEATQLSLGRTVALKVLSADVSGDESFRERFRREGRIQAGLDHPHIVPVFAAGELGDQGLFLAMRIVRGPTLKQLVRSADVSPARALALLAPVADALDAAHEAGLVHRDIKPQNILIGRRDHPYLADFGLTRAPGDTAFTKTGHFVGTLDYIAPEQIQGEPPGSGGDVYSLAAVAFECLTGSVPFPKPSEAAILFAHMSEPPPRASGVRPGLGPEIDAVLRRGLAKDPTERHGSPTQLIEQLEAAIVADAALTAPAVAPVHSPEEAGESTEPTGGADAPPGRATPNETARTVSAVSPTPAASSPTPAAPAAASAAAASAPAPPAVEDDVGQDTIGATPAGVPTRADRRRDAGGAAPDAEHAHRHDHGASAATTPSRTLVHDRAVSRDALRPSRGPARTRLALAGATTAIVVAATAGALSAGDAETPAAAQLTSGPLRLTAPQGWRPGAETASEGLELSAATTAVAPGATPASMTVGMSDAMGPYLLADDFLARLPEPPPRGARLRLGGGLEALRYDGLRPEGAPTPMTVLAAPTTEGVATVVCEGAPSDRRACEGAAAGLRLSEDVEPVAAGPRKEYADAIAALVRRLERRRAAALEAWRRARTRRGQGAAAAAMADAFAEAREAVRKAPVSRLEADAHAALGRALDRAEGEYRAAASAARGGDADRYTRARNAGVRAERQLRRALLETDELGYGVG